MCDDVIGCVVTGDLYESRKVTTIRVAKYRRLIIIALSLPQQNSAANRPVAVSSCIYDK